MNGNSENPKSIVAINDRGTGPRVYLISLNRRHTGFHQIATAFASKDYILFPTVLAKLVRDASKTCIVGLLASEAL